MVKTSNITKIMVLGLLVLLLIALPLAAACAKEEPPAPTPTPTPAWEWPDSLVVASEYLGSGLNASTASWAPVLEEQTGMKVRVVPEGNMPLKARMLDQEVVGLVAMSTPGIGSFCTEGQKTYATRDGGPIPARMVWLGQNVYTGFMVRGDSDIQTIYDIKEHKVCVSTAVVAQEVMMDALVTFAGLTWDDCTKVPYASFSAAQYGVRDGDCDVAYSVPTSGPAFEMESGPHGIRWLEFPIDDEEGLKAFLAIRPTLSFGKCNIGVESAQGVTMAMIPYHYYALPDTDPELIYHLVKWLDENFALYKDKCVSASTIDRDSMRSSLDFAYMPVHEGTIKYLKEIGMWTEADDARQARSLDLQNRYIEAYQNAIDMADEEGIKIDPENEEWVTLWENYKEELELPRVKVLME